MATVQVYVKNCHVHVAVAVCGLAKILLATLAAHRPHTDPHTGVRQQLVPLCGVKDPGVCL